MKTKKKIKKRGNCRFCVGTGTVMSYRLFADVCDDRVEMQCSHCKGTGVEK